MIEYRVCWSASSNITFKGATDWESGEDFGETAKEVEEGLDNSTGFIGDLLDIALNASGFECWTETREVSE